MRRSKFFAVMTLGSLLGRCNVVYYTPSNFQDPWLPRDAGRDIPDVFDRPTPRDTVADRAVVRLPDAGFACVDGGCAGGLSCVRRRCGEPPMCLAPVRLCEQDHRPVCDCSGATAQNECAAVGSGVGVDYVGPCARAVRDGGAEDGFAFDAVVEDIVREDAGPNRCAFATCDDGQVCCAEPSSPDYGRCALIACPTCCRRTGL